MLYRAKSYLRNIITIKPYFDEQYYLSKNHDIKDADISPFDHYMKHGYKEGRNPNSWFQSTFYLQQNPDVESAGINPLVHFLTIGWKEKRLPNRWTDIALYRKIYPSDDLKTIKPLIGYLKDNNKYLRKFIRTDSNKGISDSFDYKFYIACYDDLKHIRDEKTALEHWEHFGKHEHRLKNLEMLCSNIGYPTEKLPKIEIEVFHRLNPLLENTSYYEAVIKILQIDQVELVRISESDKEDSEFYLNLGIHYLNSFQPKKGHELLLYSVYLQPSVKACELLGNNSLDQKNYLKAITFYQMTFSLVDRPPVWVFVNLCKALSHEKRHKEAIQYVQKGASVFPHHSKLLECLDEAIEDSWKVAKEELQALSNLGDRYKLMQNARDIVDFYAKAYRDIFREASPVQFTQAPALNFKKILIIGDFHISQCKRYRIDQKIEQLAYAGYVPKAISWTELHENYKETLLHDIIIYYRTPAIPIIIKSIEKAKSLGKVVFYEIDDLIFDEVYPQEYESYSNNISIEQYGGLIFGMPLFKMSATLCHFVIGSTLPLLRKLEPLCISKKGYLHRNGLDSQNIFLPPKNKPYVNIFYGSGTLAHNTDFLKLALPALERILMCDQWPVRLTIVGHLSLPRDFVDRFKEKVKLIEKTTTIVEYWKLLNEADINLAVLEPDEINDTKSELKWFEAACFQIPSVVSNTQNYLDVLEDGKDALIAINEKDWHDKLCKLIEDKTLRRSIGLNAYEKVMSTYSIENLSKNIDTIIKSAVNKEPNCDA